MEANKIIERERSKSLMMIKPHQQHRILTADKNVHIAMNSQIPDNSKRTNSLLNVQSNTSNGIVNNNKHPHLSPMISIPSLSINKNENMKGIATNTDNIIQGAPSNLMKLKLDSSTDNKESKEYLRKRIKDLEKDVLKLTNHIQQAEHSIKNYRHCLSEKSPRYDDTNSKHISIQTDFDIDTLKVEQELKSSQDKIHSLLNEIKTLRELKDTYFKERKNLNEIHQKNELIALESIKTKEDIIKKCQLQIQYLEDTLAVYKQTENKTETEHKQINDIDVITTVKIDTRSYHKFINRLRKDISEVKHYYEEEISNISNTIKSEYQNRIQSILLAYLSTINNQNININKLHDKINILQNDYIISQEHLEISNQEIKQLKLLLQQSQIINPNDVINNNNILVTNTSTTANNTVIENMNNISDISKESIHSSNTIKSYPMINSPINNMQHPHTSSAHKSLLLLQQLDDLKVININQHDDVDHYQPLSLDQGCSPFRSPYITTTAVTNTVATQEHKATPAATLSPVHISNHNHRSSPQETKYKLYIAELELEYKDKINQLEVQQHQLETKHRLHMNRQDVIHNDKLKQIESQYKQQIEACNIVKDKVMNLFNQEQEHSKHLQQCIYDANTALQGLQEVHIAEIKAIKHDSHIKDLLRVNKEREISLEKDKLIIDINHLKEIQSILTFSISTAEQSLEELQPHVVVKLTQGRIKRMKLIEQNTKLRLKDLDQRSLETCAVSATHLDGFQIKANKNIKIAQEMTQIATNKLIEILKVTI